MSRYLLFVVATLFSMTSVVSAFDLQGHRGARGLVPENTLPAFAKALSIGVTTLELDTGVTKDGVVIVSHNPVVDKSLARGTDGKWLMEEPLIKDLTFSETQAYDVGRLNPNSRSASRFPDQVPVDGTRMPSLAQVFDLVKKSGNTTVRFNIETKISPLKPDNTVDPKAFAEAVLSVVKKYGLESRMSIQSFDWRTLQQVQQLNPKVETVYLSAQQNWMDTINGQNGDWTAGLKVADFQNSLPKMVKAAGGAVWSPFHRDLTPALIKEAQSIGLKVVPWTVNDAPTMKSLIKAGVDGLISDYPDVLRSVLQEEGIKVPAASPVQP